MTGQQQYKLGVKGAVGMLRILGKTTIYRTEVSAVWNAAGQIAGNPATIPGAAMSAAMEEVAQELGGKFMYDVGPGGKRINVRIEF